LPATPSCASAFALALAADTHPLKARAVLERLRGRGLEDFAVAAWAADTAVAAWAADTNVSGLEACQALALRSGAFCFGATRASPTSASFRSSARRAVSASAWRAFRASWRSTRDMRRVAVFAEGDPFRQSDAE
jgi:maleylacetoacetate isomerase